ncbi:MAG: type I DNA topoisomerase [Candidatus Delongbacteria bacterium]|jgi:DNA topoisomerase-1|nr:type I DNA topoisomerase [Candidatus Delongbacteria bacterium]
MSKELVILESPGKVKAISKYLGPSYNVIASNGHIIDLPSKELGVDVENDFKPTYKVINNSGQAAKILKKIESLAKTSSRILIATDPDREGEAIGWHIANRLKNCSDRIFRISFNEITKKGIQAGLQNEGKIDTNLVDSQQARRIMDRLVGYKVSPFLWKTVSNGLSAGRVQSVALRIICERDNDINLFNPEEYWTIKADFSSNKESFTADLVKIENKDFKLTNKDEAKKIENEINEQIFKVSNITKKKVKKSPTSPFITSTLLQAGVNKLGYSSKKVMQIAQQLYEGIELGTKGVVGLITYMRTDSTRISTEAIDELRDFVTKKYGVDYVVNKTRKFKSKKNIQDAHEAVRPTSVNYEPKKIQHFLTKDQFRVYQLIWARFVATQMKDALFDQTVVDIDGGKFKFRISGRVNVFKGFLQVLSNDSTSTDKENESSLKLPKNIDVGKELNVDKVLPEEHFTKPPARFNEASITKELEDDEIGRPSTYATIIERLIVQKYIEKSEKKLISTELGNIVNKLLIENFSEIFNIKFTKKMEKTLDKIAYGEIEMLELLNKFYKPFEKTLETVNAKRSEIKKTAQQLTGEKCPTCKSGDLIIKWGKNGKFIACNNFPKCKYTSSLDDEDPKARKEIEIVGKCDKCNKGNLIVKYGKFGKFVACDNYPECKNIISEEINVSCPTEGCDGHVKSKITKKGKKFYGCSNFPKCTFATWNKPINKKCDKCGHPILEEVNDVRAKSTYYICPSCKEKYDTI